MSATLTTTSLPSIGLEELNEQAALQRRFDSKFLITAECAKTLPLDFPQGTRALQIGSKQSFSYCSIYFDTAELKTYRDAAHGRRRRFKVRTRAYCDSGIAFLEVKTKGNHGLTEKFRQPHNLDELYHLSSFDREFIMTTLMGTGLDPGSVPDLRPTLMTGFERSTYLVPDQRGAVRVTVDTGLYWENLDPQVPEDEANLLFRPSLGIVEVKSPSASSSVNRLLWRQGLRPGKISKYCTGTAALNPGVPANKWHRTLATVLNSTQKTNILQEAS